MCELKPSTIQKHFGTLTEVLKNTIILQVLKAMQSFLQKLSETTGGVENGLHWTLDMAFREDECRIRKGYAPENFSILRQMALNLLKSEKSFKGSINTKRLEAAWNKDYLKTVINYK